MEFFNCLFGFSTIQFYHYSLLQKKGQNWKKLGFCANLGRNCWNYVRFIIRNAKCQSEFSKATGFSLFLLLSKNDLLCAIIVISSKHSVRWLCHAVLFFFQDSCIESIQRTIDRILWEPKKYPRWRCILSFFKFVFHCFFLSTKNLLIRKKFIGDRWIPIVLVSEFHFF